MKHKGERVIKDEQGNDTGVREDDRGAMYIDHKVFFSLQKTQDVMKTLRDSELVADIRRKNKDKK